MRYPTEVYVIRGFVVLLAVVVAAMAVACWAFGAPVRIAGQATVQAFAGIAIAWFIWEALKDWR